MTSDQWLHESEIAFFGKIIASISHELNNVLSIINEYSGLLNDLCYADKNSNPVETERVLKITSKIAEQIKREQNLIKLLNRFAHRLDIPIIQYNLNELVNDIIKVSKRFASLKKVTLEFTSTEENISSTNNPMRIQFAIFSCLQLVLNDSQVNDRITSSLEKTESHALFKISSRLINDNKDQKEAKKLISSLVDNIGGKINYEFSDNNLINISLLIPLSIPEYIRENKEDSIHGN
jgi:signal transduction histidine kinase